MTANSFKVPRGEWRRVETAKGGNTRAANTTEKSDG